jgi:hypothetical protein
VVITISVDFNTVLPATTTRNAMRERLEREKIRQMKPNILAETLLRIGQECATLPLLDNRQPAEIIGYDVHGVSV